jgi:fido (protein-threonine AMPylation protein)
MAFESSPHRWSQVRMLPRYPEIQSLADYEQAVSTGTVNAMTYLLQIDTLHELRFGDFQHVHHRIFEKVHPWAGHFRTPGQMTTVAGFPAADPRRVERELLMAILQTSDLLEEAVTKEDSIRLLAALAFLHIRFERIHPFLAWSRAVR